MAKKLKPEELNKVTGGNQIIEVHPEGKQGDVNLISSLDKMNELNRDLNVPGVKSDLGTSADDNALPNEIQNRGNI